MHRLQSQSNGIWRLTGNRAWLLKHGHLKAWKSNGGQKPSEPGSFLGTSMFTGVTCFGVTVNHPATERVHCQDADLSSSSPTAPSTWDLYCGNLLLFSSVNLLNSTQLWRPSVCNWDFLSSKNFFQPIRLTEVSFFDCSHSFRRLTLTSRDNELSCPN